MNEVNLIGNFTKEFEYSHSTNNIKFYSSIIKVSRLSGITDYIPVITQNSIDISETQYVHGELRVFNRHGHSFYYVYSDFSYPIDEPCINRVELIGRVRTHSQPRKTPMGSYIMDAMLNIENKNSSYSVPLIFWNILSKREIHIGDKMHIVGRLQSREYIKNNNVREILEVSVNEIL